MPYTPLRINPGVDVEKTPLLLEAGFSQSQLIRFFNGILSKLGGWQRLASQPFIGICRGMWTWADLSSQSYIAIGTNSNVEIFYNGQLYDVTPLRKTSNVANSLSTVINTNVVTVTDPANGVAMGDEVNIVSYASVGGAVLQGLYTVQSIVDANNYTISSTVNATSTINFGGSTSMFTTTLASSIVRVTLNNHGITSGAVYTAFISTTVGGVTIFGPYVVGTVINANNFEITVVGAASSSTTGFENGDLIQYQYLLSSGPVSATPAVGWGEGGYGEGGYGQGGTSNAITPLRQWSMLNWGQLWIGCPTNGAIYLWDPSLGVIDNPAILISVNAPPQNTGIFLAMPQRQLVAFGAYDDVNGYQDPLFVRWCDIEDFTDWIASTTNQAGSYRIPKGSAIIGGMQGPQFGLLWTDIALWQMQYINFPLVYGFNEVASGCGLIAMRATCILGTDIFWMSYNSFFVYSSGTVIPLPCSVWDILFQNLNFQQQDKICMGANSHFNEFFLFYPSLSGSGENDSYVKYTKGSNVWDYGTLTRTAWVDQSIFSTNNPLGTDTSGLIQQHETTTDADGAAMISSATTGWFKLSDGELYAFIERCIGDFKYSGNNTMQVTVAVADYPNDVPETFTFNVTSGTEYNIIRLRGRLAQITISSSDLGSFWRLGEMLFMITPSGRR